MKKILYTCYCAVFFAACLFFFAGAVLSPPDADAEGRELAAFPSLREENGRFNTSYFTQLNDYFTDRFTLRQRLISLDSRLRETVFGTGSDRVIVGRDGYLFYAETAPDFTGDSRLSEAETEEIADVLRELSDYAAAHGARFLVAVAPNKNTVYPDKMPAAYRRTSDETNLDALLSALDARDVLYADLRPALTGQDFPTYHRRDTHWNGAGALAAYNAILDAAAVEHESYGSVPLLYTDDFAGDLDGMLYPGEARTDTDCLPDVSFEGRYIYTSAFASAMDMTITTRGGGEGRLLMFRDSFGSRLIPYFSSAFAEARYERAFPYRIDILSQYDADLVILEIAERNIPLLASAADRIRGAD